MAGNGIRSQALAILLAELTGCREAYLASARAMTDTLQLVPLTLSDASRLLLVLDIDQTLLDATCGPIDSDKRVVYVRGECLPSPDKRQSGNLAKTPLSHSITSQDGVQHVTAVLRPGILDLLTRAAAFCDFVIATAARGAHPQLVYELLSQELRPDLWRCLRCLDRDGKASFHLLPSHPHAQFLPTTTRPEMAWVLAAAAQSLSCSAATRNP
jgi:hypothetical protein